MKTWLTIVVSALMMGLLSGCSRSEPGPAVIELTEEQDGKTIESKVGDEIVLKLAGNPTTGYEWVIEKIDAGLLEMKGDAEYKAASDLVGGGGVYTFRFRARGEGETNLEMAYRRPFEEKEKPAVKTFTATIKITP